MLVQRMGAFRPSRLSAPMVRMGAPSRLSAPMVRVAAFAARQQGMRALTAAPAFDGEIARLYGQFFNQLKPSWVDMLTAVDRVNTGGFGRPKSTKTDPHLRHVLDIASGPGQPALLVAEKYRSTNIECTDVSPDMVAQAAANVAAAGYGDRVKCSVLDMNDLSRIEPASIDLVSRSWFVTKKTR